MDHPVEVWLQRILGHEGEYSADRSDRGNWTGGAVGKGEFKGTKWGVSAAAYPDLDIENLSIEEAAKIYRDDYLAPIGADRFHDGVAFQLLDFAINSGVDSAKKSIQRAVGVTPDGFIGPISMEAIHSREESDLIMLVLAQRIRYMVNAPTWNQHGAGWMRRIANNLRYGAEDS
jgi:lysozyme family protein